MPKYFPKMIKQALVTIKFELELKYQSSKDNIEFLGKEIRDDSYLSDIKMTTCLILWYFIVIVNKFYKFTQNNFQNLVQSIVKNEAVYNDIGFKSIPMEFTSWMDEPSEIFKCLRDENIDPTSYVGLRSI